MKVQKTLKVYGQAFALLQKAGLAELMSGEVTEEFNTLKAAKAILMDGMGVEFMQVITGSERYRDVQAGSESYSTDLGWDECDVETVLTPLVLDFFDFTGKKRKAQLA